MWAGRTARRGKWGPGMSFESAAGGWHLILAGTAHMHGQAARVRSLPEQRAQNTRVVDLALTHVPGLPHFLELPRVRDLSEGLKHTNQLPLQDVTFAVGVNLAERSGEPAWGVEMWSTWKLERG
jgi:hypothetical protein